mmetsp:Transcript_14153/g.60562  ORF Transcript_14153/g.60562 Transcript_14153/m.60562 type:complete len:252 (+) Transcript_14153:413-1168(+)
MPFASSKPATRSASRMAVISGVVTMMLSVAPAMALMNPTSIPAGQSMKMYWNFMSRKMSISKFMLSFVTLYFWRFLLMGRSASERHRLSRIRACSMRHSPSSTSMAVYITRFSRPRSRSRLRRPMSASTRHTRYPKRAMLMPRLAEVVVLPTPPLPEVITITRASPSASASAFASSAASAASASARSSSSLDANEAVSAERALSKADSKSSPSGEREKRSRNAHSVEDSSGAFAMSSTIFARRRSAVPASR